MYCLCGTVLLGISPPFDGLSPAEGKIIHALLTRAPLYSLAEANFLVRLACVRHAASVDSEPGSNSRLKPVVSPSPTEVGSGSTVFALESSEHSYLVRMIKPKPDSFSRLACSTNLSKILSSIRLSGLVGSRPRLASGCPRTCLRSLRYAISCTPQRFCANPLNISNFALRVKP